ncbi:ADP-ribosylation/Crystallin J1 [Fusarium tricinctum]|uniref:ADP-ribosylhydrolase ARH3 n=1 Tax=Fusarium tricinctum TaxID=61284 RepID=A0A8K0WH90_9HYPO|nr:ADP-ribosylation/Crystallin J1 [Fusarium tricinctum]
MSYREQEKRLVDRESRIIGALLGVHAGDSLGATLEFAPHDLIASDYPGGLREIIGGGLLSWSAGQATDDTDMTRAVLLAYRDVQPGQDIARLSAENFLKWEDGDWPGRELGSQPKDIGLAVADGLEKYRETQDPDNAGAGRGRAGNGSLMRCIPTGLFQTDLESLIIESERISRVTHDDKKCTVSCAAYNTIVSKLINGTSAADAIAAGQHVAVTLKSAQVNRAIELGKELGIATMAKKGASNKLKDSGGGFVLDSLSIAIAALLDKRGLEDVLVDVVRIGGDTDTNAAIAGGLLGARDGEAGIPLRWRTKLQFGEEFKTIALGLLRK